MPSSFYVTDASPERPFLALCLDLDKYLITRLAAEVPPPCATGACSYKGLSVADVDPDILHAFLRLVELLEKPEQIPILGPLIVREIHYRLLIGPQGEFLRRLNTLGTQSNQIAQAITWLRDNYREPLQVDKLAQKVNMATSTFHRHFKEVPQAAAPVRGQAPHAHGKQGCLQREFGRRLREPYAVQPGV